MLGVYLCLPTSYINAHTYMYLYVLNINGNDTKIITDTEILNTNLSTCMGLYLCLY